MSEVIPEVAVEAAANAISQSSGMRFDGFWSRMEDLEPEDREYAVAEARAALEAAAPHMLSHEREETRLAHLDAVVNAQTANKLQAQVDAVLTLANELLRDGERADHYADHGQGQATGVREAIEGAEIAHRIRAALRPTP